MSSASPRPGRTTTEPGRGFGGEVLHLALPALGALLAQPLFLLADSAIVGHLGTSQLAGLAVAGSLLTFTVSLCIFLTFGSTAVVSRRVGADAPLVGVAEGAQFAWIAAALGVVLVGLWSWAAPTVLARYGVASQVQDQAKTYLDIAVWGLPPALVTMAATGMLRGLQDTWTTLVVAGVSAVLNVALNLALVYGMGLGIAGSATGTTVTQYLAAAAMVLVICRRGRSVDVSLRPVLSGVRLVGRTSGPLLVRTLTLVVPLLSMTWGAARCGTVALAAHQVVNAIWNALTLGLDSLAVAAQAMVGRRLGASDTEAGRRVAGRMVGYGVVAGVVLAAALSVTDGLYAGAFTTDPDVATTLSRLMIVVALTQPVSGAVFVLDGILIGAGDFSYLAKAGLVNVVVWLPFAAWAVLETRSIVAIWLTWALFMVARLATLGWRTARHEWAVAGSSLPGRRPGRIAPELGPDQ